MYVCSATPVHRTRKRQNRQNSIFADVVLLQLWKRKMGFVLLCTAWRILARFFWESKRHDIISSCWNRKQGAGTKTAVGWCCPHDARYWKVQRSVWKQKSNAFLEGFCTGENEIFYFSVNIDVICPIFAKLEKSRAPGLLLAGASLQQGACLVARNP